jgi:hypothetical protein
MCNTRRLSILSSLATFLAVGLVAASADAQVQLEIRRPPKPVEAEAVAGEPFGVGRITFELPPNMLPEPLGVEGVGLGEKGGRAIYPALDNPALGKIFREILDGGTPLSSGGPVREQVSGILRGILDQPPRATIYFLFQGAEPLELSLEARQPLALNVVPRNDPIAHRRLLQMWWRQYARPAGLFESKPDYPPLVNNYLMATLARRLNLRLPEQQQTKPAHAELRRELGLNLGTESLRAAMMQDRILGLNNLGQPADQPLPELISPPGSGPQVPEAATDVKIEPIAMRVPPECFYARFGSYANFLWLQDTLAKWGGDVQNLIALRGLDRGVSSRIEKQLVLKQTVLSRMLGDTIVADVAIIGTDMFFREGASYGILFQARNNFALSANLGQQRQERIAAGGVKEEKVKIGGKEVSYLASPDGRVRSYYVVDGDYHFVTTSKNLVAKFLATALSGEGGLGHSRGFRYARSVMPLGRNDTIWVYVSDAFFRRNLASPHYRIEMARRLQAAADIQLVQLAHLAGAVESRPTGTIEEMRAASLLPPEFGPLPDGSRIVFDGGEAHDSVRGWPGAFVPVIDMPVEKVTQAEAAEYKRFAETYYAEWGPMDPIIAGIKRTAIKDNREQVVIDLSACPLAPQHFKLLRQWLGSPDDQRLTPIAGDMAALELVLDGQRIFAGLRDVGRPPSASLATWLPLGRLRDFLVGYIGTTGELGLLSVLNIGIPPGSDPDGFAAARLGGWRRQFNQFTVFSFQREVLEEVVPQLRFQQAPRPAQVRLRIDDVSHARITPALNDLGYGRTRQTSLGNVRFLQGLTQQLHVPPPACKDTAEHLLEAKLICPLGGKYVLRQPDGEPPHWTSTALGRVESGESIRVHAPPGYQSPPLSWFRGLDLDATMTEKTLSAHAEVIMQMPAEK